MIIKKDNDNFSKQVFVNAFVIEASNEYEAQGKGMAIAQKLYPSSEYYYDHFVAINDGETIVTPENAKFVKKDKI